MFGSSGIRGPVGSDVTADVALSVGRAVASLDAERVVVGRDARGSGEFLQDALAAGVRECGGDVIDVGVAATPTIARAVSRRDADVGVAITASHNPPEDNGIKLLNPTGQAFDAAQREAVTDRVRDGGYDLRPWDRVGSIERWRGARAAHLTALRGSVNDVDVLSVVVDLGNGVGGVTADALSALGCDVETLNAQPDGRFPGRPSEPTAETCRTLCATVAATDADLGIAHDGDADRMLAVDGEGRFVPKDVLLALFAREAASAGDMVAAPVDTSLVVDDVLSAVGASLTRTPVGDVYVAERVAEAGVPFGGEPSGAWIWADETLCPDGPLAACKLLELVTDHGPLADLVDDVEAYPIRRGAIETVEKEATMDHVSDRVLETYDAVETIDGVRVDLGDAWFLLRASGTQPIVRVTAEARTDERADEVFDVVRELLVGSIEEIG